ncbi:3-oxoacyl-[acyl-carrier-protein] synthase III C-terminal domain-containing protein [Paraburkholderia sp. A3RO-2L]|uniref:3-oxoacyl-[acyl-carrier-protein] synthase III C-terminal domain-containing protein n=1 Tax=Paraburkholderia sp. A3RO-2L TaxID=3028376 RepID=UPI003DA877F9
MNTPVITALATAVPETMPLSRWLKIESARRLKGHPGWDAWMRSWQPDYGHWLQTWPRHECDGLCLWHHALASPPDMAAMVPVEGGTALSGLAAKVTRTICRSRPGAHPVDVIMFCHSSLDEHVSTTIAGRLCAEVGTSCSCFAFSVSQQQGASVFTALRLAADLFIAEPDVQTMLIVAAEKWFPPFSRCDGAQIVQGDGAGALLLERASEETKGLQVIDAAARPVRDRPAGASPAFARAWRVADIVAEHWTPSLIATIESLLARNRLRPDEVDRIIGHRGLPSMARAVCELFASQDTELAHEHHVHLGAAESIVRLAHGLGDGDIRNHYRVLLWGFGLGGFVGAALLEAHGAPALYLNDHARVAT